MKNTIRIALLIPLVPYVFWLSGQAQVHGRWVFAAVLAISVLAPALAARVVQHRLRSALVAIFGTPILIGIAMYLIARIEGDRDTLAWLPITIGWAIVITAPVWLVESIAMCAMKSPEQEAESGRPD
jgi:hypothetical protein